MGHTSGISCPLQPSHRLALLFCPEGRICYHPAGEGRPPPGHQRQDLCAVGLEGVGGAVLPGLPWAGGSHSAPWHLRGRGWASRAPRRPRLLLSSLPPSHQLRSCSLPATPPLQPLSPHSQLQGPCRCKASLGPGGSWGPLPHPQQCQTSLKQQR